MLPVKDLWHCLNLSAIHYNTDHSLPNIVLPAADQTFSSIGTIINILLILTIHVHCKISGDISWTLTFYTNMCLANVMECANCWLIYQSSEHEEPPHISTYLTVASGVQDTVHFVRIGFMLPLYIIRLLYVASPSRVMGENPGRYMRRGRMYCCVIWTLGASIGAVRTYARTKINAGTDNPDDKMEEISFCLLLVNIAAFVLWMTVPLVTILYLLRLVYKYRYNAADTESLLIENQDNHMICSSLKSALASLMLFYLTDMISAIYLTLLTITALKIHHTPGCYPAVFLLIRNYLGTATNFVYSYHCLGVLYGACICVILFSQNTMKRTLRFIWIYSGLVVTGMVQTARRRLLASSYSRDYVVSG